MHPPITVQVSPLRSIRCVVATPFHNEQRLKPICGMGQQDFPQQQTLSNDTYGASCVFLYCVQARCKENTSLARCMQACCFNPLHDTNVPNSILLAYDISHNIPAVGVSSLENNLHAIPQLPGTTLLRLFSGSAKKRPCKCCSPACPYAALLNSHSPLRSEAASDNTPTPCSPIKSSLTQSHDQMPQQPQIRTKDNSIGSEVLEHV